MGFRFFNLKSKTSDRTTSSTTVRFFPTTVGEYDDNSSKLTGSIAAWLPFLFLISILPTQLYLTNALNFEYRSDILCPYFGLTLLVLFLLVLVGRLPNLFVQKGLDGLFFLGVFAVLSFGIIPIQWGELNGHDDLRESLAWAIVQSVLFIIGLLCWLHIPSSLFRKPGAIFVSVLLISQLISVAQIVGSSRGDGQAPASTVVASDVETRRPNIYHVVFDAYSGRSFRAMSELVMLHEELKDFTYFPRAMAHYPYTDLSVPSYLTGKTYKSGSLKKYQSEAKTGGLSELLRKSGYKTASYSPNRTRFWSHSNATQVYATSDEFQGQVGKTFMLVAAVRAAPEFFRQEVHTTISKYLWDGENAYSHYKKLSVPLVEKFLLDEKERADHGHYNYVHLILPHGPYVRSGDCSIEEVTSYLEQAECATRLMKLIVAELKELDRYNNSIIVFQSDHGSIWEPTTNNPIDQFPPTIEAEYRRLGHFISPEDFLGIMDALLLAKPSGTGVVELKESDLLVQLVDIPATVADLAGVKIPNGDGRAIFSNYSERDVSTFIPTRKISTIRQKSIFGKKSEKVGVFGHFSFSSTEGWKSLPEIDIFHEGWMGGVF